MSCPGDFNREVLSPYLDDHRPCYLPSEEAGAKGKLCKRYRRQDLMTPYEKLKSLPDAAGCLKPGTFMLISRWKQQRDRNSVSPD